MTVLFQGKAENLREIAQVLEAAEIRSVTGPMPGGGGWGPNLWLAVASPDAQRAAQAHRRHQELMVEREGLPVRDLVADFNAEETQCPACLAKWKTAGTVRCPDCGLKFG